MKIKSILFVVTFSFIFTLQCYAATYYVGIGGYKATGASTVDDWSNANCYGSIGAAIGQMSAGDEVVVNDGTYSGLSNFIDDIPGGTSAVSRTTVRARNKLDVRIENGGSLGYYDCAIELSNNYIEINEFVIVFNNTNYPPEIVTVGGSYNYVKNCIAIRKGVADNYSTWFSAKGSYNLIEDCAGAGHVRYGFFTGGDGSSDNHNIFRRCVGRADYSDSNQPMATFNFYGNNAGYGPNNIVFQNCIAIDGQQADTGNGIYSYIWGGWYFPKNVDTAILDGCIVLNVDSEFGGFAVKEQLGKNVTLNNCVSWDNKDSRNSEGYTTGGTGAWLTGSEDSVTFKNVTFGNNDVAFYIQVGDSMKDCLYIENTSMGTVGIWSTERDYNGFNPEGQSFGTKAVTSTDILTYITRIENGLDYDGAGSDSGDIGATIIKKIGVDGTYYGQIDWNTVTANNLWPFPNEAKIRELFRETNTPNSGSVPSTNDTTRGFCADGETLTDYIWGYLGSTTPPGLGDNNNDDSVTLPSLEDLSDVEVSPNPFKPGRGDSIMRFTNLSGNPEIRIYTVSGELVKKISKEVIGSNPTIEWDVRNAQGENLVSGVYVYCIVNEQGAKKYGKFTIIK